MSAITSLVLKTQVPDDENQQTFVPTGNPTPGLVEYFNLTGDLDGGSETQLPPLGQPRILIGTDRGNATRNPKLTLQIDLPVLAATSPSTSTGVEPAAVRAYNTVLTCKVNIPRQSSLAHRQDLRRIFGALANSQQVKDFIEDLSPQW